MQFEKLPVNDRATRLHHLVERVVNSGVRRYDDIKAKVRIGGRKANYDDEAFEFVGGARDRLRKKHYDKSLRLLWKAEDHTPFLPFADCSESERALFDMALRSMTDEEKQTCERLTSEEYKAFLKSEYTERERQAIVNILSAIGHGEAYAWLVAAELLNTVQSTGGRAALTMQVLEEAKHFLVLRELLRAFDVPVPPQSAWEYMFLEGVYKADGLEKLFGMNVVVEGIALGFFGLMSTWPGLEVLRQFHLDEARHTGLPHNYLSEFPMTPWQKHSPVARLRRLKMVLPALALMPALESDMAELGIDAFEFGGATLRKIGHLAQRNGFLLPVPVPVLLRALNHLFNGYCRMTRPDHEFQSFLEAEVTMGTRERAVEQEVLFGS